MLFQIVELERLLRIGFVKFLLHEIIAMQAHKFSDFHENFWLEAYFVVLNHWKV